MKKIGLALLGLAVVLVAALLIAPSFVDWNAQKGRISKEVFDLTGRDLAIDGDVSLALLPAPALSAAQVRLANVEGGSAPSMVELEALKVRIALLPLLRGEVKVERVDLVKPRILAEVLPDGRGNWEFAAPGDAAGTAPGRPEEPDAGVAAAVSLDRVTVTDGTLIYRDVATGLEERIEALNAEVAAESLKGPFAAAGQAKVRGIATEFELSLGGLVSGGATPISLGLRVPKAEASLQLAGALSLHGERTSLRGRMKLEGTDLAALAATLPPGVSLPAVFARPFSAETDIAAGPEQVTADKLLVRLADTEAEGEIRFTLEPGRDLQVRLSATRVDLDALLALPDRAASAPAPRVPAQDAPAAPAAELEPVEAGPPLSLPEDMTASLDLAVDALVYRDQVVRQLLVSLSLEQGRLKIGQALALLPGGSDVSLSGAVAPAGDAGQAGLRFDGRLEAGSDNLRGILNWLGIEVAAVPASRLRKMSLTTAIGASQSDVMLSDIDLRFDLSRITGGIALAVRERLGVGIGLALDKIDLDAYLPAERQPDRASAAAPESGVSEAPTAAEARTADTQEGALSRPGFAAPRTLGAFDANFDLRIGQMTLREVTAANLHLDATLQQGSVALRELLVGDVAGAKARLSGTILSLTTAPAVDAAYELDAPDPARLAKVLGVAPGPLAKAKDVILSGTVKGGPDQLDLSGDLQALGGRFEARGRVKPLAAPLEFDLDLTGKHADLAQLSAAFAPEMKVGSALGALDLSAKLTGTPRKFALSALQGQLGPLILDGGLTADLAGLEPVIGDIELSLAAKHSDIAALVGAFAPDAGLAPGLELDLAARMRGAQDAFRLSDIAGKIGPSEVKGSLEVDLRGARPKLVADLAAGVVPLAAFAAPAAGAGKSASATGPATAPATGPAAGAAAGTVGAEVSARWSRAAIDTAVLGRLDADLKLRADALIHDSLRLERAVVDAALVEGVIDLRKLGGTVHNGAVLMTGKIDAREGIETGLALTAVELNLAKLLKELADSDRVSGPLNLEASIAAKGRSEAELVASLTGKGDVSGTLNVTVKAEEQVGNIVLGILGQKVKEIRGVTDTTNTLFGAFAGTPAALEGSFTIDQGVVETNDLRLKGRDATALTQGTADLAAWRIDTRTQVQRAAEPDTAYLTVDLTGPLDKPNPRIAGQPFRREAAPAAPAETPAVPAQPAAPQQIKPEDIIKKGLNKGLKDLLKGLGQ